jgi:hypothetical protein
MTDGQMQTGETADGEIGLAQSEPTSLDMANVREQITELVCQKASAMISSTIAQVEKGHYTALKFLLEIAGIYPIRSKDAEEEDYGLAKTLLERLGLQEEASGEIDYERLERSR